MGIGREQGWGGDVLQGWGVDEKQARGRAEEQEKDEKRG